jgi:nucleoside 2-deoxyribosyltransferase
MNTQPKIYLAGPIAGATAEAAFGWRNEAADMLDPFGLKPLDPTIGHRRALLDQGRHEGAGTVFLSDNPCVHANVGLPFDAQDRHILERDFFAVKASSALLLPLSPATEYSRGTIVELGWAYALGVPVVTFGSTRERPSHPFVNALLGQYRFATLNEAVEFLADLLFGGRS